MKETTKVIVSEHILEVRHAPSGRFLDVRGYVADHIKGAGIFDHWQIDTNVVNFRDAPKEVKETGAFAGFKSAGFFAYDPKTKNYFEDKAGKFWRTLVKNQFYPVPEITRFGCRTKAFLNSAKSFEEINETLYAKFFTEEFKRIIGEKEKDLQAVIDLESGGFKIRIMIGPLRKKEAKRYFSFESEHFKETGIYLDVDVSKDDDIQHGDVSRLTKGAMSVVWDRIDSISSEIGV